MSTGICPPWPFCLRALAARGFCPKLWSLLSGLCSLPGDVSHLHLSTVSSPLVTDGNSPGVWGRSFTVEPWRSDVGALLGHLLLRWACWQGLLCQLLRQLARSWLPEVGQAGPPDLWGGAVDPRPSLLQPRPLPPAAPPLPSCSPAPSPPAAPPHLLALPWPWFLLGLAAGVGQG